MADRLSLYDYLGFVVPGATILFAVIYGMDGWPRAAPGSSALVGLVAAAFVIGYANASVGNALEPVFLGARVGTWPDPLWGTLAVKSRYSAETREYHAAVLAKRYPGVGQPTAYKLAYTELQQLKLDGPLQLTNQHIGFARGMATACLIGLLVTVGAGLGGRSHLPLTVWVPAFAGATMLFVQRYRRAWFRFGDGVLSGIALVDRTCVGTVD